MSSTPKIRKCFCTNRRTMERHRLDGFNKSNYETIHKSLRKRFKKHKIYEPDDLPSKVDLRRWMPTVKDQGDLASCTAHAIAGFVEYIIKKTTGAGDDVHVSRLFLYYNSRREDLEHQKEEEGTKNKKNNKTVSDAGAPMVAAIEALKKKGFCSESDWPYDEKNVNNKPFKPCYRSAKQTEKLQALKVNSDLNEMRSCLAQGFPIIFGLDLYESFGEAGYNGGAVPMPKLKKPPSASHAMLAVGYSDSSQAFIVRNSFGKEWGDKGYCYIPYEYMKSETRCSFLYTLKLTEKYELGKQHWKKHDNENYMERIDSYRRSHPGEENDFTIEICEVEDEGERESLDSGHRQRHSGDRDDSDDEGDASHRRARPSGSRYGSDEEGHTSDRLASPSGSRDGSDEEGHASDRRASPSGDRDGSVDERHASDRRASPSGDQDDSDDERHCGHTENDDEALRTNDNETGSRNASASEGVSQVEDEYHSRTHGTNDDQGDREDQSQRYPTHDDQGGHRHRSHHHGTNDDQGDRGEYSQQHEGNYDVGDHGSSFGGGDAGSHGATYEGGYGGGDVGGHGSSYEGSYGGGDAGSHGASYGVGYGGGNAGYYGGDGTGG
ncbi:unnamed protein product [Rotaria magnacalcarata]|uniref:Peptidase C1A papain C-terminal domain-containing protein n=5 Tax=Rotaria magnacalcarata TaxID=392030 RepID=A0A816TR50_9BILA|nr:unnamed protein product [Rotaria magnacalcarata]